LEAANTAYADYGDIPNKDASVSAASYTAKAANSNVDTTDLSNIIADVKILMNQNIKA
jgi:hypothetical protein